MKPILLIIGLVLLIIVGTAVWWFVLNPQNALLGKWENATTGVIIEFTNGGGYTEDGTTEVRSGNYEWRSGDSIVVKPGFGAPATIQVKIENNILTVNNSVAYKRYKETRLTNEVFTGAWKVLKGKSTCIKGDSVKFNSDGTFAVPTARGRFLLEEPQMYLAYDPNVTSSDAIKSGEACRAILSEARLTLFDRSGQVIALIRQ